MTVLGLPPETALVFVATVVAGSIGAAHYAFVRLVRDEPFERATEATGETEEGSSWR